jgi:murein L,D-transpeptidase YcbB/YkuD
MALVLFVAFVAHTGPCFAQDSTRAQGQGTGFRQGAEGRMEAIVVSGRLAGLRWPDFATYRAQVAAFYRAFAWEPVWLQDGQPTAQAVELVAILQDADREGLNAEDYDASRWAGRLQLLRGPHAAGDETRFDAALTICAMRYLSDLHSGRINPQIFGVEFDVSQKKLDLAQFVRERLVEGSDLRSEVAGIGPPFPAYQRLRDALQHYKDLAKRDDGEKLPNPLRLSADGQYAGRARLIRLLRLVGDLPQSAIVLPSTKLYQSPISDAVKHYQQRHGLRASGDIDAETVAEMNVPLSARVQQIRMGMERYRWLPFQFTQPPLMVNIPEFRLYGLQANNEVGLSMNVDVGDQYDFQTPMFEKSILYVVFRPYWYPPAGILRTEVIPPLEEDPSLEDNDLELISASGHVIRSGNVTPAMLQDVRDGKYTVRQPPGPDNALGLVKFIFPNKYHVYIHDSPISVPMFSDRERSFSHGCIHVQDPARLAAWLLRNTPGWNLDKVQQAMHSGRNNVRVNLGSPVPVLIVYQTAVARENGEMQFFPDLYGHDADLIGELARSRRLHR